MNSSKKNILIIDKDTKNLQILKSNFEEAQFNVDTSTNDADAFEKIKSNAFDLVLSELSGPGINGYRLLENIQREMDESTIPVIFLTQQSDVWNRVKSLKLGAKDFIVKPMHVQEVISRVNLIISRIYRRSHEKTLARKKFVGRLEDISLVDLIQVFGIEKKTGVLSLFNENNLSGQVFFKDGHVINASCNSLDNEEAVYKMFSWTKGRFSMLFCEIDATDNISISNMGILLEGAKRMEQREEILKQLPSLETVVITTSNFKKLITQKELNTDLKYFLELFNGQRALGRIIDESKYDEITTLKRILKLYRLGFLNTLKNFGFEEEETELQESAKTLSHESRSAFSESNNNKFDSPKNFSLPEEEEEISTPDFIHQSEPDLGEHRPFFSLKNDPFYDIRDESDEMTLEEEPQDLTYSSLKLDMEKQVKNNMPLAHPADALFKIDEEHPSFINTPSPEPVFQENVQNDPVKKESELKTLFAKAKGNILILSIEDVFRKNLVNVLTKNKTITSKSQNSEFADIDYGTIEFKSNKLLNIISFSLEKEFGPLMEFFSKNSLGYLLLVDTNKINWRYYNYLLKVLNDKLKLPSTIVIQTHGNTDITEEKIKQKLELKPNTTLQIVNTLEYKSAKRLIFSLFKPFYTPPKTPVLKEAINHSTL